MAGHEHTRGDDWGELFELLRIPSISADPDRSHDVRAAVEWVCDFLRAGGGTAEILETDRHPLAVGEFRASSDPDAAPTVLLYGHVDVQPPGPRDAWESDPFDPEIREGCIYARGAADDKGQFYALIKGAELLSLRRSLPINVRIIADAEEEVLGSSVIDYLREDARGADACVFFDDHMPREGLPGFAIATRGIVYFDVQLRTGAHDLHSGLFGGTAVNAVHALMDALNLLTAVPESLRTGVLPPSNEEVAGWEELEPGNDVLKSEGAIPLDELAGNEFYQRTFASTSVDVNGFAGGEAVLLKTVLPVTARANVSIRLAPGQNALDVAETAERLLHQSIPAGAQLDIVRASVCDPAVLADHSAPVVKLAQEAFGPVFGRRPILIRSGGSLPLGTVLVEQRVPTIGVGFALRGSNMHAPNERIPVSQLTLAVEAAQRMLQSFERLR